MNIEVVGTSTRNKGAELMLVAIKQHYDGFDGRVLLAATPWFGPYADRAKYGLLQKVEPPRWGRSRIGLTILPPSFRKTYGLVTEREIGAVIDASGFAFGDQHPLRRSVEFADDVRRWKQQGKRVVLLPQALGPFEKPQMRDAFRRIVDNADLVYARDVASLEHVHHVVGKTEKVALAPDITIGIHTDTLTNRPEASGALAYIVPNSRMLDKMEREQADQYLPFLDCCIDVLSSQGLTPKLLLHDNSEDHVLADALIRHRGQSIDVVREPDPVRLKRLIGEARLLIGSRFHSLVGALSQATPAIAAGWSHKYDMLMNDFGCGEMIVSPSDPPTRLNDLIRSAVADGDQLAKNLIDAGTRMRAQLSAMWEQVDRVIGLA